MELLILFGVVFLVIVVAVLFLRKTVEKVNMAWRSVAETLELQFHAGDSNATGIITGKYKNHLVQIDSISKSLGPHSNTYTRFKCVYAKPINFRFEFSKKDKPDRFGRMLGNQDGYIQDSSFYDNVKIKKGKWVEKAALTEFLNAPRRYAVKSMIHSIPNATITNEYVEGLLPGLIEDVYLIKNRINSLAQFADIISKERNQDHPLEQAKQARLKGEIQEAVELVQQAEFVDKDDQLEAKELEGELFYLADEKDKAAEAFHELVREIPEDTLSKQWEQMAQVVPVSPAPLSTDAISMKDFSAKVFESGISTFDSTKRFEKEYRDSEISWEGTLISAAEFSFDFVFKNTTGVKATFELMEIEPGYISNKIKAVVHFPKDQMGKLKGSVNQKMKFTGKLVHVDGLVKNIFIAEGKIQ